MSQPTEQDAEEIKRLFLEGGSRPVEEYCQQNGWHLSYCWPSSPCKCCGAQDWTISVSLDTMVNGITRPTAFEVEVTKNATN